MTPSMMTCGGSPRSVLSATQSMRSMPSMPSIEQQAFDIDRLTDLEAAAALGSSEAQYEIACMVLEGRGVPRDVGFATAWFGCASQCPLFYCNRKGEIPQKPLGISPARNLKASAFIQMAQR